MKKKSDELWENLNELADKPDYPNQGSEITEAVELYATAVEEEKRRGLRFGKDGKLLIGNVSSKVRGGLMSKGLINEPQSEGLFYLLGKTVGALFKIRR